MMSKEGGFLFRLRFGENLFLVLSADGRKSEEKPKRFIL